MSLVFQHSNPLSTESPKNWVQANTGVSKDSWKLDGPLWNHVCRWISVESSERLGFQTEFNHLKWQDVYSLKKKRYSMRVAEKLTGLNRQICRSLGFILPGAISCILLPPFLPILLSCGKIKAKIYLFILLLMLSHIFKYLILYNLLNENVNKGKVPAICSLFVLVVPIIHCLLVDYFRFIRSP